MTGPELLAELARRDPRYAPFRDNPPGGPMPVVKRKGGRTAPAADADRLASLAAFRRYPLAVRRAVACVHRGGPTGDALQCVACGGTKTAPGYGCAVHGVCSPDRLTYRPPTPGVTRRGQAGYCTTCRDYVPVGEATALVGWADRIVLINLDRRPDRLRASSPPRPGGSPSWPGGSACRPPTGRPSACRPAGGAGRGRPAAARPTCAVLADAVRDGIGTLAVFEDDARFAPDFSARLAAFLAAAPADWEGLLLGCEGQAPAPVVGPGVRRVVNAQRTHAYVVRGRKGRW
jgi:hypothetical protein